MSLREHSRKEAAPEWDGTYNQRCKAYGCPLGATVITDYGSYTGAAGAARRLPKAGLCGYHNGVAPEHWQRATLVLNRHIALLRALHALDSLSSIEQYKSSPSMVDGDPETKPKDRENTLAWKARMRTLIRQRIDKALQ